MSLAQIAQQVPGLVLQTSERTRAEALEQWLADLPLNTPHALLDLPQIEEKRFTALLLNLRYLVVDPKLEIAFSEIEGLIDAPITISRVFCAQRDKILVIKVYGWNEIIEAEIRAR